MVYIFGAVDGSTEARDVLNDVFGHADFRGGQARAVDAVLSGRDAVVLLPTGAGKSLCYQVPAVVAARSGRGATIVISPLIALMDDQVRALLGRGVVAAAIHSHMDEAARRDASTRFARGEIELLYVSPERAALASFKTLIGKVRVALLAIDEAHCLSQWGHDFRPEYMKLCDLRPLIDGPTIALTATATPRVIDEVVAALGLQDVLHVRGDFGRPNLSFSVHHLRADKLRLEVLSRTLEQAGMRERLGQGRAIVYCASRKKAQTVCKALRSTGFSAGYYHAGRTKLARERAANAFTLGRTRILVATNAFGMGIDYPDVRVIVHFQAPGSLEAYYQEAGRAGRDGAPADCLMFFGAGDLMTQRRLQSGNHARNSLALAAVQAYASATTCRQQVLCDHFTATEQAGVCGCCDVCNDPMGLSESDAREVDVPVVDLPAAAKQIIVEAVGALVQPIGKTKIARALRGSRSTAMAKHGLTSLPQHGRLKQCAEADIVRAIEALLADGTLERRGSRYLTVWLPGRAVPDRSGPSRGSRTGRTTSRASASITRALDNYRKRTARALKWKPYMVFQRRVITAIDRQRPDTHAALERIPGLGRAKIDRFGDDILELVRQHSVG